MDSSIFIFFLINVALSGIVAYVAHTKGRSAWAFFWLSIFFSFFIGIIVALAIAPGDRPRNGEVRANCPYCMEQINALAVVCKHCGKDVEPQVDLVKEIAVERSDKTRGTKLIIGIVSTFVGALLLIPNIISAAQGYGVSAWWFIGILISAAFIVVGVINIRQSVKSAHSARKGVEN